MLQYLVFWLVVRVVPLPPRGVAYWICDRVGDLLFLLLARRRRTVARNLAAVLRGRPADLDRRVREVFRHGARYYYDTFRVPALSDQDLERLVSLEGWDHLKAALAGGKGAVLITAHLGSPAVVAQMLGLRGYRVTTPAEAVRPRRLFDLMARVRGGRGITLLPLGSTSTREFMEVLKRNEIMGAVADRDVQKNGVPVEFFGGETTLPAGPMMLALRTGAAVVMGFCRRLPDGRFEGHIGEPLELERTGDLREDLRRNTQKMAREFERAIEGCPEQWVVFEPIWPEKPSRAGQGSAR